MEGPESCEKLISKAATALDPGGKLLIHDFILNEDKISPSFAALFSLNMLVGTQMGRTYASSEIIDWLKAAGVLHIEQIAVQHPNESSIICATF